MYDVDFLDIPVTTTIIKRRIFRTEIYCFFYRMTVAEYNECVEKHADGLYRFLLANIRSIVDAEDLVQDSFEKLWKQRDSVAHEKAKSYLFTTGYHTMIDRIRRKRFKGEFPEDADSTLYHTEHYNDLKQVLQQAVERLSEIQRVVITLRDYEGYSYEEIGAITGLNESQVKVYIYRARMHLKKYIGSPENVI